MKKNRWIGVMGLAMVLFVALTGCGREGKKASTQESKKIQIVCDAYPQYEWVKEIIGKESKRFQVTMLLKHGTDLHSYQPSADDVMKIGKADLFIYVGGSSDEWAREVEAQSTNKDFLSISLLRSLGNRTKKEVLTQGMEEDHDDHDHADDEHVWLSLKNAKLLVQKISKEIQGIDSANAKTYEANTKGYIKELDQLDGQYQEMVKKAKTKTILFGDRFPFRYLMDDYGIKYFAAFPGCSAETEASFKTMTYLAKQVDSKNLKAICVMENSNQKMAKTIRKSTKNKNQKIIVLNSMQSVSKKEQEQKDGYLKVMKQNLTALNEALN